MPRTIHVRNVPERVHRTLKSRAAAAGMSLSDYVKRDLEIAAAHPTLEETHPTLEQIDARVSARGPSAVRAQTVIDTLREAREA